jgi:hypothetical protein
LLSDPGQLELSIWAGDEVSDLLTLTKGVAALMTDDRPRRVVLVTRRALLMICAAMEREFRAEDLKVAQVRRFTP